jgi:hypothetical protein
MNLIPEIAGAGFQFQIKGEIINAWRTHLLPGMDTPESRSMQLPARRKRNTQPEVAGLHHHYERVAD